MSANMVDPEHIHVLIWAAIHARATECTMKTLTEAEPTQYNGVEIDNRIAWRVLRKGTETAYGQFLVDANAASVNARYDEDDAYVYEYRRPRRTDWAPIDILAAIDGYEYQACEVRDWATSEAREFCTALRRRLIARMPGYEHGPWQITAGTLPGALRP